MTFDQQKNIKAVSWTLGIHILLLLIFLNIKYVNINSPLLDDFDLELVANLGTTDNGLGIDQPEMMGDPAPLEEQQESATNPEESIAVPSTTVPISKDITTVVTPPHQIDVKDDKSVTTPDVATPKPITKPKIVKKEIPKREPVVVTPAKSTPVKNTNTATIPKKNNNNTTAANTGSKNNNATPKYTYSSGIGSGGNGATQNNPGGNQGIGTGNGDMGTPGGSPKGLSYTGGISGRKMISSPSRTAEFRENGTVSVKIWVNREGVITRSQVLNARNETLRKLALEKISQIKYAKDVNVAPEQSGTITFTFKAK